MHDNHKDHICGQQENHSMNGLRNGFENSPDADPDVNRCMDPFLDDFMKINFIHAFCRLKLPELIGKGNKDFDEILAFTGIDSFGLKTLLDVMCSYDVVSIADGKYCLTKEFISAITNRELFDMRMNYSRLVLSDLSGNLLGMIRTGDFLNKGIMGKFWQYPGNTGESGKTNEPGKETVAYDGKSDETNKRTKRWVDFISTFTRSDSRFCTSRFDFSAYRRILELGGNSGEFAIDICSRYDDCRMTIFDLPEVADIGIDNVTKKGFSGRIGFVKGDFFSDRLPSGNDLIVLKSTLVDWSDEKVRFLLKKCHDSLTLGGKILIYEHRKIDLDMKGELERNIVSFNFIRYFRDEDEYRLLLEESGFSIISSEHIPENDFMLIVAEKMG